MSLVLLLLGRRRLHLSNADAFVAKLPVWLQGVLLHQRLSRLSHASIKGSMDTQWQLV
jgi:uncharacterized protein (DUF2267 family)